MKGADIQAGKRYAAKIDFTEHVLVDVLETGVERQRGYSGKARNDGVRVRVAAPYVLWGRERPAGAEKVISTRDVQYEWTEEHQQRRDAREAERRRTEARMSALRDALIERRIDGKVDSNGLRLSLDVAERLFGLDSAALPRQQHRTEDT